MRDRGKATNDTIVNSRHTSTADFQVAFVAHVREAIGGKDFAFDGKRKRWVRYRRGAWETIEVGNIRAMVRSVLVRMAHGKMPSTPPGYDDVGALAPGKQDPREKWMHKQFGDLPKFVGWLVQAMEDATAHDLADADWDHLGNILVVGNGTLVFDKDGRSVVLRGWRREDFATRRTGTCYVPRAKKPVLGKFLVGLFRGERGWRRKLLALLEDLSGALTSDGWDEVFVELLGAGANGKSRLVALLLRTFGDYGKTANQHAFTSARFTGDGSGASPHLAALEGRRFVAVPEVSARSKLNAASIKAWTSKDEVEARALRQDPFTYKPGGLLLTTANAMLSFDDQGQALASRIRSYEFPNQWARSPEEHAEHGWPMADERLGNKLAEEAEAMLAALVRAWLRRARRGKALALRPGEAANKVARDDDRLLENSLVRQFLRDCCTFGPKVEGYTPTDDLHWAFRAWAKFEDKGPVPSKVSFGNQLAAHDLGIGKGRPVRFGNGKRVKVRDHIVLATEWRDRGVALQEAQTRLADRGWARGDDHDPEADRRGSEEDQRRRKEAGQQTY